jgi:hypothetical protein
MYMKTHTTVFMYNMQSFLLYKTHVKISFMTLKVILTS